jgi:hypothetical protein
MATLPRIHLNGTHATTLLSGYAEALAAVDRAILAVLNITVHGRDYYVISDAAIDEALAEHRGRLIKLNEVRDELQTINLDLIRQNYERLARRQTGDCP